MDVVARIVIALALGLGYALGGVVGSLAALVLFPLAAGRDNAKRLVPVYMAVASAPLALVVSNYSDSTLMALMTWLTSWVLQTAVLMLVLSQRRAFRPFAVTVYLLMISLPPWGSWFFVTPLPAAGWLFPGSGYTGLMVLTVFIASSTVLNRWKLMLAVSASLSMLSHANAGNEYSNMVGIDTARGMPTDIERAVFSNAWRWQERQLAEQFDTAVVFPESIWVDGNRSPLVDLPQPLLGGTRRYLDSTHYVNEIIDGRNGHVLYSQRYPVPLPFGAAARAVAGDQKNQIDALICIELLQPGYVASTFANAKGGVIWISNLGWTHSDYLHRRLVELGQSWSKLFAKPLIRAVNHPKVSADV